jgi:tetratricopeptide (TPR) repeat protein
MASLTPSVEQEARIAAARDAWSRAPDSVPLAMEVAAAHETVWQYREAIRVYDRALLAHPDDWRLHLGRAHRLLRLRRLGDAEAELERTVGYDPEGFNARYLLGFTRYAQGDFEGAAEAYQGCVDMAYGGGTETPEGDPRTCFDVAADPASRVALTSWLYRALSRAGRGEEAARLVVETPNDLTLPDLSEELYAGTPIRPGDNTHYYLTLLFFAGRMSEREALNDPRVSEAQWPTVAYAVAAWHLAQGDSAAADTLLARITARPEWARLGHVAAEMDFIRLRLARPRS